MATATATAMKNILLVDDDEDFRDAMARVLAVEGYHVRCAMDGEQGLRMATEEPPDLVILDLIMPVKDGFETMQGLAHAQRLRDIPILALTAFGQSIGEVHGAPRIGPPSSLRGYLEKPIEFNVFLARVAAALAPASPDPR